MTIKDAKSIGRELGFSINKTAHGEYRVAPMDQTPANAEAQSHYSDDLTDAVDTMRAMYREQQTNSVVWSSANV